MKGSELMAYVLRKIINSPLKNITSSKINSDFGPRTFYNKITKRYETGHHNGIDMTGSNVVVSAFDGIVTSTRNNVDGYTEKYKSGNYVTINHGNNLYSTYCHLKKGSICVKKGQYVVAGTKLGIMGKTGHATGIHLHFGIKKNGKFVDPKPYLLNNIANNKNNIEIIYIVKKGDNLSKIAKKYHTTWKKIYEKNKELIGDNPNLIYPGWELKI